MNDLKGEFYEKGIFGNRKNKGGCMKKNILVAVAVFAVCFSSMVFAAPSLTYSTYLGTTVEDKVNAMEVDAAGYVYLTGQTAVVADKFPGTAAHYQTANNGGAFDTFVIKISPAGAIVWATYLGGAGDDRGLGIAVDTAGIVYVCGSTTSAAGSFPTAGGTIYQTVNNGGTDGFLTAIAASGNSLVYSTFIGGAGEEFALGVAVNNAGDAYVTGGITSDSSTRPATAGAYQINNGLNGGASENAFIAKFSTAGVIQYFTYLGGSVTGGTRGNAITIDAVTTGTNNAYITGYCRDTFPTFPKNPAPGTGAFKETITGAQAAFVAKISSSGANLLYSSYLGGSGYAQGKGIKLDSTGNVYIAGDTDSGDFPDAGSDGITTSIPKVGQTTIVGNFDCFIMKMQLNNTGHSDAVYCTFLGGSGLDNLNALEVDSFGDAYVTGRTESNDFVSVSPGSIQTPLDSVFGATAKAFVTAIGPDGSTRVLNTYLGGVTDQEGMGIALDAANNIYVSGWTNSTNFPTAVPLYSANKGSSDAFVMKISATSPAALAVPVITSLIPNVGPIVGGTTVVITGTGFSSVAYTTGVKFGDLTAASYKVNSDTRITAVTRPHAAGRLDTVITNAVGASLVVSAGKYTYFVTPDVTSAGDCDPFVFPSPVTDSTAGIAYCMAGSGVVKIKVYNEIGDLVSSTEESKSSGPQGSTVNVSKMAPGIYFYIVTMNYDDGSNKKHAKRKFAVVR